MTKDIYANSCADADCQCRQAINWPDNIKDGCFEKVSDEPSVENILRNVNAAITGIQTAYSGRLREGGRLMVRSDDIANILFDLYDVKRMAQSSMRDLQEIYGDISFGKLPKDNDGSEISVMDCIESAIDFIEQLELKLESDRTTKEIEIEEGSE